MVELAGDYEFAAPHELVWEMMLDPEVLAMTIPGCESLEQVGENTFQGRLNIKVGPVQGVFQGKVESSNLQPPSSFHIVVNGSGPAGVVRGEGNVRLDPLQAATRLSYDGSVQVSGRIASVGQRVMDSSTRSIVKQSLQNLEAQILARLAPVAQQVAQDAAQQAAPKGEAVSVPPARPVATPPPAPGQADFIYNVARDVMDDLLPDPRLRKAVAGLGLTVVILGLANAFANLVARRVTKMLQEEPPRDR